MRAPAITYATAPLRRGLPPLPDRIKALPIDARGYPIPWFVASVDGKLGRHLSFVIGPMSAINRNTSEPGCHRDCAQFAVRACPLFLVLPDAQYRTGNLPSHMRGAIIPLPPPERGAEP